MRLAVPDLISNSYFPAIAAAELGFFKREGLDIEHVELHFPVTKAMEGLRDGEFDLVAGAAHATLHAFPGWEGAKLLAAVAQHMYWFLVVRADVAVTADDLTGLRGLRVGAAPGPDLGLLRLLREVGLASEHDVQVAPVPGTSVSSTSFGVTAAQALADGRLDGFWANGMGAEVAVRQGIGKVVLDVRRGDGPPAARRYTFAALVARDELVTQQQEAAGAAVRGLIHAQRALAANPSLATDIGRRLFPPAEAELIADLIRRDGPYYDAQISPAMVAHLNQFARDMDLLEGDVPYVRVVAEELAPLWRESLP